MSMKDTNQQEYVIEVNNVCKDFKVYFDKGFTLKERLLFWHRNNHEVRHVLKNISFKVKKGEAVGLIGQNGAGKSTTLKLLSKIIYPNSGSIVMRGRVSCLIELGAGFHPDMSGRENIYTNAAIFGLKREEIDKRIDDIIAFSELEEFIDNPVRTYSSGMYMRLAFSVAINVDADILLIDEILAVGDAAFQAKCFNKLLEIKEQGTTIVIVSHSMDQIQQICDRAIWFKENHIELEDKAKVVCESYMKYMYEKEHESLNDSTNFLSVGEIDEYEWNAFDDNKCVGFGAIENNGDEHFRWLEKKNGEVIIKNLYSYSENIGLMITYFNTLPLMKMKKYLKLNIGISGYNVGCFICNIGLNTIILDVAPFLKQINEKNIRVTFEVNYLWKPIEYFEDNNDTRNLGVGLVNVKLIKK